MSSKKKVAPEPVPYHKWFIMQARLYTLNARGELNGYDQKKAGRLTKEERGELAFLKKRCKSSDDMVYALLHHCEAIAGGVVVPKKERGAVCTALKDAYRVSGNVEGERGALVNALATLGVAKADLPKCIYEEDEEEKN